MLCPSQSRAQQEAAAKQELETARSAWQAESAASAAASEGRLAAARAAHDVLQERMQVLAARLLRLAKREARREKQRGVRAHARSACVAHLSCIWHFLLPPKFGPGRPSKCKLVQYTSL